MIDWVDAMSAQLIEKFDGEEMPDRRYAQLLRSDKPFRARRVRPITRDQYEYEQLVKEQEKGVTDITANPVFQSPIVLFSEKETKGREK